MLMILVTLTFLEKMKKNTERKRSIANAEERKKNIDEVENDVVSIEKFKLKRKRGRKRMKKRLRKEKLKAMLLIRFIGKRIAENGKTIFMPNS